jgi:hypothetical protein
MKPQDYAVKKFVRATSVQEAILLAEREPVHEVFLVDGRPDGKPKESAASAVGFSVEVPEEDPEE